VSVLLVTRSDDNASVDAVAAAIRRRGHDPIRIDTDRYPDLVRLSTRYDGGRPRRRLFAPEGTFDLGEVEAVWYRRFHAGATLPPALGDMRAACVDEARRTLLGTIAALDCFQLDPLEAVRRTDHKELQILRAAELGLDVPRTLFSNDPAEVLDFYRSTGALVTKMQSSFAIYRGGVENVVFTNLVDPQDLDDLSGLRYCPMVFQEHIPKALELRVTVVGRKVMAASIDSQRSALTRIDWRRDGVGLIEAWRPYSLPEPVARGLLALLTTLGLNYGAADFVVTPEGRHVFLEVNAVGEFFWLTRAPGLPIAEAIADVLLGRAERALVARS
jgi:glutathione synthase/RimK-type ligase-like ATP-grasp enzyme